MLRIFSFKWTIDRDNIISKKEWRQGLRRLGVQVSDAECEILFRVFDRDKSGSMDVEEVCYMFQVDYRSKDGGDGAKRLLDARLRLISRTPTPTALDSPGMCQREPSPTKSAIIGRTPSPFGRRTDGLPPKSFHAHDRGPSPTKGRSEWRGGGGTESPTKIDQRPGGSALQVERRGGSRMSSR